MSSVMPMWPDSNRVPSVRVFSPFRGLSPRLGRALLLRSRIAPCGATRDTSLYKMSISVSTVPVPLVGASEPPAMSVVPLPDSKKNAIFFFGTQGPHGALSNFSPHAFSINGVLWKTVEHYYQVCVPFSSVEGVCGACVVSLNLWLTFCRCLFVCRLFRLKNSLELIWRPKFTSVWIQRMPSKLLRSTRRKFARIGPI